MIIFGIRIERHRPDTRTSREQMFDAIDELNRARKLVRSQEGRRAPRPWVVWDQHHVVASQWQGEPVVVHE